MGDTNYISSIVKILEIPSQKVFKNNIISTRFRVQLPQIRKTGIVNLIFWGNLARDVSNHYKINDYIIIEGYSSLNKTNKQKLKKVEITVFKVYPFHLNSNR
jgi:hypothetical protein